MCCHFLLQGIFLTQGSKPCLLCLLHWQMDSLPAELPGKPTFKTNNAKPSLEQGLPGWGKAGTQRAVCNQRAQERTERQLARMLPGDHLLRSLSFPEGPPPTAAHLSSQIWTKTSGFSQRLLFLFMVTVLSLPAAATGGFFSCLLPT